MENLNLLKKLAACYHKFLYISRSLRRVIFIGFTFHCIVNKKLLNMSYMRGCAAALFKSKSPLSYCGAIITFMIS